MTQKDAGPPIARHELGEPLRSGEGFVCLVSFVHNLLAEEQGSWDIGVVYFV